MAWIRRRGDRGARRSPRRAFIAVALSAAWALPALAPTPARACTCMAASPDRLFARADVVVDGLVVEVQQGPRSLVAFVAVDAIYAGEVASPVRVLTDSSESSCGLSLRAGERWVIAGELVGDGVRANLCGGSSRDTKLIDGRTPIARLADAAPAAPVDRDGAEQPIPLVAASIALAAAALTANVLGRRAARR